MSARPLTSASLARRLKPRPAVRRAALPLHFEQPLIPPALGVRVFPPAVAGSLLDRPDRSIGVEESTRIRRRHRTKALTASNKMNLGGLGGRPGNRRG